MTYSIADVMSLMRLLDASEATERQHRVERQKLEARSDIVRRFPAADRSCLAISAKPSTRRAGVVTIAAHPCRAGTEPLPLSAVYRTGQRFGSHHLVDILLGHATERVVVLKHNQLKTFGVGNELDRRSWLSVFRQLVAQGFVLPDLAGYGGLTLAPAAEEILRRTRTVRFRLDPRGPTRQSFKPNRRIAGVTELDPVARSL
jgi:ATP-dependent DNA helicase RecQ